MNFVATHFKLTRVCLDYGSKMLLWNDLETVFGINRHSCEAPPTFSVSHAQVIRERLEPLKPLSDRYVNELR